MSFKFSSSDSNFLTDSTLVLEPIVPLKIRVFQNSGFPFLLLFWRSGFRLGFSLFMSFEVSSSDSNFLSDSTLVLEPIVSFEDSSFSKLGFSIFIIILKIRVPNRVSPFYVVWSFEFRLELPIGFIARVGTDRSFEDSSFSKFRLSIFIIILKVRVSTRVFPFYDVWSFEFWLKLPIGFNARVGTDRSFWRFEFFKTRVFHFYYYFEDPGSDSGFPFLCRLKFRVFELEFRLPIGFNAHVGTDRSFVDSSFSKLGFSIFIFILKIRVPTRVFPFYVFWCFEFWLELSIGFNARFGTDRSFENSSFQNSGFPFLLLFWRSGFRLGFSLFMSFEVLSSDSNFLSDSTLVLEPIVPLKIRVFQNSGFPYFYYYFEDPGSELGFSLFMSFKFLEFRLELPNIGFNARVGTDRSFEDSSFSKLGFSIFIIILKIRVPTRVFPFYVV